LTHDEIGRDRVLDRRGERIHSRADLRSSKLNAHPDQGCFAWAYQKNGGTEVATRIAPEAPSKPGTIRRKQVSVKLRYSRAPTTVGISIAGTITANSQAVPARITPVARSAVIVSACVTGRKV
jgi:hypothetical protein